VRADSGNDISKENPSLVEGAAGGCGSDPAFRSFSPADFVSVPIANFLTVGGSQARRVAARAVLLDFIARIIRLRNDHGHMTFMKSRPIWQGWAGLRADPVEKSIISMQSPERGNRRQPRSRKHRGHEPREGNRHCWIANTPLR
jgi:hypothetical protein